MPSTWEPLPSDGWPGLPNCTGWDPMLAYAVATGFRHLSRTGQPPELLPMVLELAERCQVRRLPAALKSFIPTAYHDAPTRYCTADVPLTTLKAWAHQGLPEELERLELQLPVIPERPEPRPARLKPTSQTQRLQSQTETLIGVIDWGCAFAHDMLQDASSQGTRVLRLWDQDPQPAFGRVGGGAPPGFDRGCDIGRTELNQLIDQRRPPAGAVDAEGCYRDADYPAALPAFSHGAAILGLLAGAPQPPRDRPVTKPRDPAADADLVFVQLPFDVMQDTSSASLPRHLLDGLRYIVACAGPLTKHIVINISDGTSRTGHDGSSIIEQALSALVAELKGKGKRLSLVIAAGNSYREARHARIEGERLKSGDNAPALTMRLLPDAEAPSFVNLRLPESAGALQIRLKPPGSPDDWSPWLGLGQAACWPSSAEPACCVILPRSNGNRAQLALLAFAPTARLHRSLAAAPSGDWIIEFRTADASQETGDIHLWISRGANNEGSAPRARQARFIDVDRLYDPQPWLRSLDDQDAPPPTASAIQRQGSLSGLATIPPGEGIHVVASCTRREGRPSRYSSAGPGLSPQRDGPDLAAATDATIHLQGVLSRGNASGGIVRVKGTSFAAPQWARQLVNSFPKTPQLAGKKVKHRQTKGRLKD